MKKIISILLAMALVVSFAPGAFAAGSAWLSGPSVVRAGDTITLTFSASGEGLMGFTGYLSYDSLQLSIQEYSTSMGGGWMLKMDGNQFVIRDTLQETPINGSATVFSVAFKVNDNLPAGTGVTVTASGVTLSDGQADTDAGSPSYSVTIAEPLSGNCNLATLDVSNATISPAFSGGVTEYSASVPYEVSTLSVAATAEHPGAQVSIGDTYLYEAATTPVKVTVTAENGAAKTYTIYVSRPRDPNYVESDNCNLSDLWVEGFVLSPAFAVDVDKYYVWLPYETETVTVGATTEDSKASVSVDSSVLLEPGKGTDIPVTVTAENGNQKVYVVTAVRAPAPEKVEQYLNCPHEIEPEPTEPPTEPVTEPEPTEVPTETTEPVVEPEEEPEGKTVAWWMLILAGVLGIALGAGLGVGLMCLQKKKKTTAAESENETEESVTE